MNLVRIVFEAAVGGATIKACMDYRDSDKPTANI